MDDAERGHALPRWAAEAVGSNVSSAVLWPLSSQKSWGERPKGEGPMDTLRPQKGEHQPDVSSGVRGCQKQR